MRALYGAAREQGDGQCSRFASAAVGAVLLRRCHGGGSWEELLHCVGGLHQGRASHRCQVSTADQMPPPSPLLLQTSQRAVQESQAKVEQFRSAKGELCSFLQL